MRNVQLKIDETFAERVIPAYDSVRLLEQIVEDMNLAPLALGSHHALSHHGLGNLQKSRYVSAKHQVARLAAFYRSIIAGLIDILHDAVQLLVNLVKAPGYTDGVLAHLQTGGSHAAGITGLAGRVQ